MKSNMFDSFTNFEVWTFSNLGTESLKNNANAISTILTKYLVRRRKERKQQPNTALSHLHCNMVANIIKISTKKNRREHGWLNGGAKNAIA